MEVDKEAVEAKLIAMGAQLEFEAEFDAILYDDEMGTIQAEKDLLRLRKEGNENILTFKKFVSDTPVKVRKEFETSVGDFQKMRAILEQMGYLEGRRLRKIRKQYAVEGAKILFDRYLDDYDFIPEFLEIEASGESRLIELAEALGFHREDCLNWNTNDLILHYGPR